MNTHELAWAAGFFDGEGHIRANRGLRKSDPQRRVYSGVFLEVAQKDPTLLHRLKTALGVGYVLGPYRNNKNGHHFSYRFMAGSFEQVQQAVASMWQWLGPIKKKQCSEALTNYLNEPRLKSGRKPKIK